MEPNLVNSTIKVTTNPKKTKSSSEITIKEFLEFVKTAYQVQESLEGVLMSRGMTDALNWLREKERQFTRAETLKSNSSLAFKASEHKGETPEKNGDAAILGDSDSLQSNLNKVLSEGLLDSVLPYLVQPSSSSNNSKKSERPKEKNIHTATSATGDNKTAKRKLTEATSSKTITQKSNSDVEIHVCDEIKNQRKNFRCSQRLLVEKMGYFAEVIADQKLEDMDISVHCDINIFEWLMRWVHKDNLSEEEWPKLDEQCVIPILVSAAFLQMEPLLDDCLLYCHINLNEILKTTTNLSCLNDSILTRLAAMYTNTELEEIKDKRDKIQSKLYTKMILALVEPEPESVRGHWNSLARTYSCHKCKQIISPADALNIPCVPSSMRLQFDGSIISYHSRDPDWNINDYIGQLQKDLKTWRKVYWYLWGNAHFLQCTICKRYFPANQIGWCRYHPDPPQYFTLDAQKAPLPVGRYPCCGERAYRFQLLSDFGGCQFRDHTVIAETVRDSEVLSILERFRELIEEEPPQLLFPEKLTRLVARDPANNDKLVCKEVFWWDGFEIIPPRPKLGLLSSFVHKNEPGANAPSPQNDECSSPDLSDDDSSSSSSTSSSGHDSASKYNKTTSPPKKKGPTKRKRGDIRLWQNALSARSNQDMQRSYEESALKKITNILNDKILTNREFTRSSKQNHKTINRGVWVRLETEWKEAMLNTLQPSPKLRPQTCFGKPKLKGRMY